MLKNLLPKDPGNPKRLSHQQIKAWNNFIGDSPTGDLTSLYKAYTQKTKDTSFSLPDIENEFALLNQKMREMAGRKHLVTGQATNVGNRFPELIYEDTNLGAVNGGVRTELQPDLGTAYPERFLAKAIPSEVTELGYSHEKNLPYFIDPQTGDIVYTHPYWINHPRFRKSPEQSQKMFDARAMAGSLLPNIINQVNKPKP